MNMLIGYHLHGENFLTFGIHCYMYFQISFILVVAYCFPFVSHLPRSLFVSLIPVLSIATTIYSSSNSLTLLSSFILTFNCLSFCLLYCNLECQALYL